MRSNIDGFKLEENQGRLLPILSAHATMVGASTMLFNLFNHFRKVS